MRQTTFTKLILELETQIARMKKGPTEDLHLIPGIEAAINICQAMHPRSTEDITNAFDFGKHVGKLKLNISGLDYYMALPE